MAYQLLTRSLPSLIVPDASLHLLRTIDLACSAVSAGTGGPFAALIVRAGEVIAEGANEVIATNDPTAHAEVVAIRRACNALGTFSLAGCALYASCEPCPMCLAAGYWSRIDAIYYAATADAAARAGFDDRVFYAELTRSASERRLPMHHVPLDRAAQPFAVWLAKADRVAY